MQAKNRDKNFQNYGWKEMEKLLNQEMPVRVLPWWKRLGFLLPFLIFTGVLLGGSLWWFNVNGATDPTPTKKTEVQLPVAPIADAVVPAQEEVGVTDLERPKVETGIPVENQIITNSQSAANPQFSQTESSDQQVVNPENPAVESAPVLAQHADDSAAELLMTNEQETTIATNRTTALTESLARNSSPLLEVTPAFNNPGYEFPAPLKSRIQFGLTASANFGNLPGLSGGFAIQKQIGKSRFSWQTGVELGVQVRDINGSGTPLFSPVQDISQDPDTTGEEITVNSVLPDRVFYMSLELPVIVRYRIAPRWSVNLGGKVGYHVLGNSDINNLISKNERFDVTSENTYFVASVSGIENQLAGNFDPNDYSDNIQRNRFYWAASAGVDWHPTNRFTLTSVFQYGVRDEYPLRADFSNRLGAEFRMTYFFNRPTK